MRSLGSPFGAAFLSAQALRLLIERPCLLSSRQLQCRCDILTHSCMTCSVIGVGGAFVSRSARCQMALRCMCGRFPFLHYLLLCSLACLLTRRVVCLFEKVLVLLEEKVTLFDGFLLCSTSLFLCSTNSLFDQRVFFLARRLCF